MKSYGDRLDPKIAIIPFRGEFLEVQFTRAVSGTVEAGPNAVLAFKREGYDKS